MDSEQNLERHLDRDPGLDQARRASVMAHSVVIKLKEMGLPDELDEQLSQVCTDLGDLWSAQNSLVDQFRAFLKADDDWDAIGDSLVDLSSTIDHIAWHMKGVREPLGEITRYAYEQAEADGDR